MANRARWEASDGSEASQQESLAVISSSYWVAEQSLLKLCCTAAAQRSLLQLALSRLPLTLGAASKTAPDPGVYGIRPECHILGEQMSVYADVICICFC